MKSLDKDPEIVFCDNHLLVIDKPAGILTQPDASDSDSLEMYGKRWLKREYHKEGNVFLHAIHRLDKPVSGLVLFARTSKALSRLNEQSRAIEIQRSYIAEVEGILPEKRGRLDHYLIHGDHRAIVAEPHEEGAKHARLEYQVTHFSKATTFVEIALETGRYHQIRAQFSGIDHPIVGDVRYGGKGGDGSSIHLHCARLSFLHPITKELLRFESSAPFGRVA